MCESIADSDPPAILDITARLPTFSLFKGKIEKGLVPGTQVMRIKPQAPHDRRESGGKIEKVLTLRGVNNLAL